MKTSQQDHAARFHELHTATPVLALANAWDVASACVSVAAGCSAVATTSAGVAWSLGAADGDALDRSLALDLIARVVAAVDVPVTADIETGFGATAAEVAETVRGVLAAGAVGVNIEDSFRTDASPLRDTAAQAERLAAARAAADEAGIALYINARTDVYLRGVGDEDFRLDETLRRARAYLDAGASGIFVPGLADLATIKALVAEIPAPVNIMVGPGAPSIAELGGVGVARASLGAAVAEAAYGLARRATEELLGSGTYESVAGGMTWSELNALFH
ncbi:2-Methylisocitrate lyase, PEP mutase family [Actinokineospora alba]|uniref:2-Methylisocitrate lyase, PEP mutase family n=1 Tax=Actinokineospora alba TaxID=504798 RepID=A0A1H0UKJ3_9PSEU|nr:isocitrate lyase/phosphoenolpyruvate mutase family protein [Actinokineospora alba]TDP65020.1 2-methylisocitrate lyase-like PEP mutase family enzyme [Actinokineospora alba]SDH52119.1 2-Methylisocitrate lyase, PEP mutase family [Actinokineospora alba]SDP66603.1 2-Methylisocitrate lyase, PEP mutase family [Actinokineospora alba]